MRLRNVKNKEEILNNCPHLIKNPEDYKGKWLTLFNNNNPIYLEIGMGKGKFLIENALKHPNINYIGIERFDSVVAKAIKKIPEDIPNLKIIRMNALDIDKVFSNEIDLIYLNFSDPWPKKRWSDRRLTSKVFLDKYDLIFIDAAKAQNIKFFELFERNLNSLGYIITDNMYFHGLVRKNEKEIGSRNLRGIVRKIKDYINFLKNNDRYNTTIYDIGDGIAVSEKKAK